MEILTFGNLDWAFAQVLTLSIYTSTLMEDLTSENPEKCLKSKVAEKKLQI